MSRQQVSKRLVDKARRLIDQAQTGDRTAQMELKDMMRRHDQQMPGVLYVLMEESIEQAYGTLDARDEAMRQRAHEELDRRVARKGCLDENNGCRYQEPHKHGVACDMDCGECGGF